MTVELWLVLVISGIAVLMDFLLERVVNGFICMGLVLGLYYQIRTCSARGMMIYVLGILVPFFLLLPLFYFRMLGAGDIKLFCVLGSILGYERIVRVMVCSFFLGALLSFAFLISYGNLKERCLYFFHYLYQYGRTGQHSPYIKKGKQAENFHFTVPVLLGVMLYVGGFY